MDQNKVLHVIVCDDDAELNSFIRCSFKLAGYETHRAQSAEECIGILKEAQGAVDAIIVDGKIAADRSTMLILNAKRRDPKVQVFVLAERRLSEEKIRIMDYGADEFAIKPMSVDQIVNKVGAMLLAAAKIR